jgi:hypothetical protein
MPKCDSIQLNLCFFLTSYRLNAQVCTLKSKAPDSVAHNAPVLVVDTPRRWEIVWERLWTVETHQFSFSPLAVWR